MNKALYRHLPAVPFEVVMIGGAIVTFSQGNWKHFAASLFTLVVCFVPLLAEKLFRIILPAAIHFIFAAFIFTSFFSGEVMHFYKNIWYWDDLMHFSSSFMIGTFMMMGLIIVKKRYKKFFVPPWLSALIVFSATIAVTIIWEISEFASDEIFGTFSQGADLFDTMMDIVYETTSAAIAAWIWILYGKSRKVALITPLLNHFARLNP